MRRFQFCTRDWFWLTLVVAILAAWFARETNLIHEKKMWREWEPAKRTVKPTELSQPSPRLPN